MFSIGGCGLPGAKISLTQQTAINARFAIQDSGTATMAAGTTGAITLASAYAAAPKCTATWTGTGALAGQIKVSSTPTGGTAGVGSVTISSSNSADTAQVNWLCLGQ